MIENRNMILAIALSIAIIVGFEYFSPTRQVAPEAVTAEQTTSELPGIEAASDLPSAPATTSGTLPSPVVTAEQASDIAKASRDEVLSSSGRVTIATGRLSGSISLLGGRIDDLSMLDYREDLDVNSANIVLLQPRGIENAYYASFGWVAGTGANATLPDGETLWQADRSVLSVGAPVTLNWDNGEGLTYSKTISIDEDYMFTVTQQVTNTSGATVNLHPYGLISRRTTPSVTGFYILHEGLLGVFDETLNEVDYDDLQETGVIETPTTGGWIGITDKYWLTALMPDQAERVNTRFVHRLDNGVDKYQVDFLSPAQAIAPGASMSSTNHFFAGAKQAVLLDDYSEQYGIQRLDLAIDWGWFYFLTKPIFHTLLWFNGHVGNLGIAILALTVVIKLLFFPLANKSYTAMSKMKALQPKMTELREQYGDDKAKLNQEMMALYKREKANPAAGCLPIVVQIPVFFALYKVLFVTIEMRHAPFFGWIQDLSAPDPTTIFNLFGLIPWDPPSFLMIGVWPLIMGISMFLQQKLNPQPADPIQAKIFLFMPIMFTFLLASFPAGLVVYWAWNNSLSILQQWVIMRRMGVKV
jgi:YidC/Oxa1 family membrane protein insertase